MANTHSWLDSSNMVMWLGIVMGHLGDENPENIDIVWLPFSKRWLGLKKKKSSDSYTNTPQPTVGNAQPMFDENKQATWNPCSRHASHPLTRWSSLGRTGKNYLFANRKITTFNLRSSAKPSNQMKMGNQFWRRCWLCQRLIWVCVRMGYHRNGSKWAIQ